MKDKLACMITDDEPYARKGLEGYIEKIGFLDLRASCEDALQLGMLLTEHPVDLLFLDIQMPHITGTEFLKSLTNPPKVIFTTAYAQYAIQGFELDVLDYLLKPISFERFIKAAYKAKDYFDVREKSSPAVPYLFLKAEGKLEKILFEEILYIEGMENYVVVHMQGRKIITHSTIKAILEKLPGGNFIQTHKSFIVSIDKIESIAGNTLHIKKHEVPVGRTWRENVMKVILH